MAHELVVPSVGESIVEVQVGEWLVGEGEFVEKDMPVVEIESDKATVELPAPVSGTVSKIVMQTGETANVGDVIGAMEEGEGSAAPKEESSDEKAPAQEAPEEPSAEKAPEKEAAAATASARVMPAAQRAMAEEGIRAEEVQPSGPGGRILKEDVMRSGSSQAAGTTASDASSGPRDTKNVPMTPMRKRIAERLVHAQQTAAILTTFNEIDMTNVMALRKEHKETFLEKYGVKLGFMSFFVKASVSALREFPLVNAQIENEEIIYHNYNDVGIAVGGGKGLVVPILRNAERMSFADIELGINDFGARAQKNKISLDELQGGTFTISNGGVYGSLLSTPILNPPQSGILGLHAIQQRPVAIDGEVVIRPMMYVALSYDHRLVDGREAVTFLSHIKNAMESPARMLLGV